MLGFGRMESGLIADEMEVCTCEVTSNGPNLIGTFREIMSLVVAEPSLSQFETELPSCGPSCGCSVDMVGKN